MSIASEITRIQGNVSDSLTAVANKGVTVPAGSNSDDLAGLIALIQTGGGGGTVTWETMYDASTWISSSNPNYFIISNYTTPIQAGETYRVTWGTGGTQYVCETVADGGGSTYDGYGFGNSGLVGGTDTGEPFLLYRDSATRMLGVTNASGGQNIRIKIEKQTTSGGGSATLITKNITANGTYNASSDSADGYSSVVVNVPTGGGESGDYTRTVIVPSQTVACTTNLMNNAYYAFLQNAGDIQVGDRYIVTVDGTEFVTEGHVAESNCVNLGDYQIAGTRGAQFLGYPFYISDEQAGFYFVVRGSGTHTVKIERLDFVTDGTTLVSKTVTANGTYDPEDDNADGYSSVIVNVPASGGKNTQHAPGFGRTNQTAYTAISGQSITVAKTGTYDVYWCGWRSSTGGTNGSCLYIGNSAHTSGNQTTFDSTATNVQAVHISNVSLTKDQVVTVRARARGTSYYMYVFGLTIVES